MSMSEGASTSEVRVSSSGFQFYHLAIVLAIVVVAVSVAAVFRLETRLWDLRSWLGVLAASVGGLVLVLATWFTTPTVVEISKAGVTFRYPLQKYEVRWEDLRAPPQYSGSLSGFWVLFSFRSTSRSRKVFGPLRATPIQTRAILTHPCYQRVEQHEWGFGGMATTASDSGNDS